MSDNKKLSVQAWEAFCDSLKPAGAVLSRAATPEDQLTQAEGLRKLGRTIIRMSHAKLANDGVMCPRDFLNNVDRMYRVANRGTDIGGWALVSFSATRVELRKTTVHHCHMEEGIVMQVMEALRAPCRIEQTRCFRRGDDHCLFVLTPALASQPFEGPGR